MPKDLQLYDTATILSYMAKEATMNITTFTINDEVSIVDQIKVCQGNLEMLNDFAPNHPLVLKNINKMMNLVEILEAIKSAK